MRAEALEQAPAIAGRVVTAADAPQGDAPPEGTPFEWLADADSRLGPILEAIINGRYLWVPLQRVRRIDIDAPEDLRDMVWTPVHLVWENGGETLALVPTRYPGSEAVEDDALRLARRTEWRELAPDQYAGLGQRMFATDAADHALLEIRSIEFAAPAAE